MPGNARKGENALVAWLRERFPPDPARVPVGIGDDMAVLRFGPFPVAITTDMLLDGVHFDTQTHSLELIGSKAVACSLSDCAAMACNPVAATVSLALPHTMTLEDVKRLYEGMAEIAGRFGCRIVGGDTTSWSGGLAIDIAMLAEPMAPRGPVLRSGARPGDILYVSGPLGGSILGSHLTFTPRLDLARRIAPEPGLHAMMDLSDGLSTDLQRLCEASACDAELDEGMLGQAISPAAATLAQTAGGTPLDHALNDGEDFELLIAGAETLGRGPCGLIPIGRIPAPNESTPPNARKRSYKEYPGSKGAGPTSHSPLIVLVHPDGRRQPVEPRGYEHWK